MWAGWLDAKPVELPREQAANPVTRRRFAEQWSGSNPRFRGAHAVASYLEHEGVAPLSAGGTLYSDEREMLDAERDYWQPRVAVHFGARLLKWALFDFGQGIPRVLVALNPTARKQTLRALDMRATVDNEEFFHLQHGEGRLQLMNAWRPLPCRRTPRLHAGVRQLAHDAGGATDFLIAARPNGTASVPKTVPKIRGRRERGHRFLFSSDFQCSGPRPPARAPPFQGGLRRARNMPICRRFVMLGSCKQRRRPLTEVLCDAHSDNRR